MSKLNNENSLIYYLEKIHEYIKENFNKIKIERILSINTDEVKNKVTNFEYDKEIKSIGKQGENITNIMYLIDFDNNFFLKINNLTTINSKVLRNFFEKIFFESSVSRGGKNRSGEYPASIKVPILYTDKYFWLRGAKAIDLTKKFPSFTVFSKQVIGSQVFNFSNFQILYLDKVKRIVEGELKHSRIKSED